VNQEIPWKRLTIEALVIVVSILLALAADAWWDGLQQREDETVMLQSLLNDLTQKQITLADNRRLNDAMMESATTLLNEFVEPNSQLDKVEVDTLIAGIMWFNGEDKWGSAPLDSLIVGGNISVISDPILRQELASIQLSLNDLKRMSRSDEHYYTDIFVPFMMKNANLLQLRQYQLHLPGRPEQEYEQPTLNYTNSFDHSVLLSDLEFQNLVDQRITQIADIFNIGYAGFEDRLANAITLIESELGK
jgi:hypothetical protein